jgi:hypothetical protein
MGMKPDWRYETRLPAQPGSVRNARALVRSGDWWDERDDDGFPAADEDSAGELFVHPEKGVTYRCAFVRGVGWRWRPINRTFR